MELIGENTPLFPRYEHPVLWSGESLLAKDSPSKDLEFIFYRNLTPEELSQINAGNITPFFYGCVQYRDMFGYVHERGFGNVFIDQSVDGIAQWGGKAFNYSITQKWRGPRTPLWVILFIRPLWAVLRYFPEDGKVEGTKTTISTAGGGEADPEKQSGNKQDGC